MAAALAILTEALDEPGTDIAHSLHRLALDATAAVTSYLGLWLCPTAIPHSPSPLWPMGPSPATSAPRCTCRSRASGPATNLRRWPSSSTRARQEPSSTSPRTWPGSPGGHRPTSCSTSTSPSPPDQTPPINYTPKPAPAQYFPTASVRCLLRLTIRIAHGPNRPTTKCLISSLEGGAARVRFRTNAVRRRATHWRPLPLCCWCLSGRPTPTTRQLSSGGPPPQLLRDPGQPHVRVARASNYLVGVLAPDRRSVACRAWGQ